MVRRMQGLIPTLLSPEDLREKIHAAVKLAGNLNVWCEDAGLDYPTVWRFLAGRDILLSTACRFASALTRRVR